MFVIYQVTNLVDGKSYVGFTVSPTKRWQAHKQLSARGSDTYLHRAMRKHGAVNFSFSVLEEGWNSELGLSVREPYWISALKPAYNMTKGGEGFLGGKHTDQTRQRMSRSHRGKEQSPEHKQKLGISRRGKKRTAETRHKMSVAATARHAKYRIL